MMGLIAQHRLREANAVDDRYVQPLAGRLDGGFVRANAKLTGRIRAADRTAWEATLAVVGIAGVLMTLLLIGLASARRRRLRTEIEQQGCAKANDDCRLLWSTVRT
jgi:hypothetical protein